MKKEVALFWFRRDLRLEDNHGLYKALTSGYSVIPIFIFDREILRELPENDPRLSFIHQEVQKLNSTLKTDYGSGVGMYSGTPLQIIAELVSSWNIKAVFTNRDYEPYARHRDSEIAEFLQGKRC